MGKIRNQKLKCNICGVDFICTSGPPGSCWCQNSPNLLKSWDLAGECLCPDCLALGKRKKILEKREKVLSARKEANFRKN